MTGRTALRLGLAVLMAAGCGRAGSEAEPPMARPSAERADLTERVEALAATTARLAGVVEGADAVPGPSVRPPLARSAHAMAEHADALVRAAAALLMELRALEASPELLQDPATARRVAELHDQLEVIVGALETLVPQVAELAPSPTPPAPE